MKETVPFKIKGIDHVVLRVKNLKSMMSFYCDVLGCKIDDENKELGLYQLRAGSQLIDLIPIDELLGSQGGPAPSSDGHNMDHFALQISPYDDESIREYLSKFGVKLGEPRVRRGAEGKGLSIQIRDQEGNCVELKGPQNSHIK